MGSSLPRFWSATEWLPCLCACVEAKHCIKPQSLRSVREEKRLRKREEENQGQREGRGEKKEKGEKREMEEEKGER